MDRGRRWTEDSDGHPPSTRYSLLLRIADPQNDAAWAEFLAIYEPLVYRLARRQGAARRRRPRPVPGGLSGRRRGRPPLDARPGARARFAAGCFASPATCWSTSLRTERRHGRASGGSDIQRLLEMQPTPTAERMRRRRESKPSIAAGCFSWRPSRSNASSHAAPGRRSGRRPCCRAKWPRVAAELGLSPGAVYIARSRVLARLQEPRGKSWPGRRNNHGGPHAAVRSPAAASWRWPTACCRRRPRSCRSICKAARIAGRSWSSWPAAASGGRRRRTFLSSSDELVAVEIVRGLHAPRAEMP